MAMIPDQKYMAIACFAMGVSALIQNGVRALVLFSLPNSNFTGVLIYYGLTAGILLRALPTFLFNVCHFHRISRRDMCDKC